MPRSTVQTSAVMALGTHLRRTERVRRSGAGRASSPPHEPRACASPRATPPDSYLQYKVYSVDQLIDQVSSNPAVRAALCAALPDPGKPRRQLYAGELGGKLYP